MKKTLRMIISRLLAFTTIIVCTCIPLTALQADSLNKFGLTSEEQQWLEEHKSNIRYAPSLDYPPIGFVENGKYRGVTAEYLRLIEERLDIRFELVYFKTWNEIMGKVRLGEVDIVGNIQDTPSRREFLRFTGPYIRLPNSIIVKKDFKGTLSPMEMDGMKVAIVKGYSSLDYIKTKYPKIIIVPVRDNISGLQMVSFRKVDAMITDLAVASYFIETLGITNLRVAGSIDYVWDLCFATRKDLPRLFKIIEKALNTISEPKRIEIKNKWISLREQGWRPGPQFWITLSGFIILLFIIAIFFWNLILRQQIRAKTMELRNELAERKKALERTEHLNRLNEKLLGSGSLSEKLRLITDEIVYIFKVDFARIWMTRPGDLCDSECHHAKITEGPHVCRYRNHCLHLLASSGRYTHIDGAHRRVPFGCYKIGRVAAKDEPKFLTNDVVNDPRIHDHEWARKLGLVSFAGYRLLSADDRVVGVLALFSKQAISSEEDTQLESLAGATTQIIQTSMAEKALRESERLLNDVFDSIQDGISVLNTDLTISHANDVMKQWYAKNLPLEGKKCHSCYQDREEPCDPCPTIRCIKSGQTEREIVPGPPGSPVGWIELYSYPIKDSVSDEVIGVVEFVRDITGRKQAEQALRDSEQRFRDLTESTSDWVWEVDRKGVYSYSSPKISELLGYKPEEVIGKTPFDFMPSEEAKRVADIFYNFVLSQEPIDSLEKTNLHKNDYPVVIETRAVPFFDNEGALLGYRGIDRDITERKRVEEVLKESEGKYRSLFESIRDAILVADTNRCIIDCNPALESLFGYSLSDIRGKKTIHLYESEKQFQELGKAISEHYGDTPFLMTVNYRKKNGDVFPGETGVFYMKDQRGEITGFIGLIRDISERIQLETQLQYAHKMEAIGTLAGGIAHDFNNILGIILGNTELAMDDVPEWNPGRLNLEEIKIASLRAKDVVRQLLSFARKTARERKPININPVIADALKLLRASIPTSIEIRSNIPKESQVVFADPTQINQIMMNLCTNAAQAMEEEGGILEISLDSQAIDEITAQSYGLLRGRYIRLAVSDTGHGIDPEIKDRIFDPYFTTKDVGKGSGMGLAVVHGIVANHDGAISVDSKDGKGSTFNVFFPIVEKEPIPEIAIDEDLPMGKERILFVDDEESIVKMGSQRLERLGYKIESTTSPIEALDLFRSKPDKFDLVITDLTMPKMTGDKLVKEILNIRPDIPIILCTGFSEKIDEEKAMEIGAFRYLEKPHEKRDLAQMVRKALDEKSS